MLGKRLRRALAPVLLTGIIGLMASNASDLTAAVGGARAAHPISVTEADVYVTQTRAFIRIQLFAEDLFLFQGLEPTAQDVIPAEELRRGLDAHRAFLLEKVVLRDSSGESIPGQVTDLKPFEIPEQGIEVADLMLHTATYQLEFPFEEPPEFLTLQQDISDANFVFPSEMRVLVHQAGSELTYSDSLKAGTSVTLRFDWEAVPPSDEAADQVWEKWFEKQRQDTLGITSYSSVYSFIYVEPAEVRHEVLVPLATLKTFLPLVHADPAFVQVDEQPAVRDVIREWLKDSNPVVLNGVRVLPEFSRIDFYGLDLKDFARSGEPRKVSLASGRAGIIMTYRPTGDAVRDVAVSWDRWHAPLRKLETVIFAGQESAQRFEFSRFNTAEDNTWHWQCPPDQLPRPVQTVSATTLQKPVLEIPLVSVLLLLPASGLLWYSFRYSAKRSRGVAMVILIIAAGCLNRFSVVMAHPFQPLPEVPDQEAGAVVRQLLEGTYRALDFGTEDRIYEALAATIDGELLEELYLQLRAGLELREQGGAVARVQSVTWQDVSQIPRGVAPQWPGFASRCTWTVAGTVEHWGHVHERQNRFSAVVFVEPRENSWKITKLEIEDQQQILQKTQIRKF